MKDRRRQKHTDQGQDDKINALEKRLNESESARDKHPQGEERLQDSMQQAGPMIQREYDRSYGRLGSRFAGRRL